VVTGRPAGWCDLIARLWPVAAVVGENGAFYYAYDRDARKMRRVYQRPAEQRARDRERLETIWQQVSRDHPGAELSADQPYRVSDYAIDFCEDVDRLPDEEVAEIARAFEAAGATAKLSSIHVNTWIGSFSKREMSLRLLSERFGLSEAEALEQVVYVGDSPNDEPMFAFFPHSVGVANLKPFLNRLKSPPAWGTAEPGGDGFAELAARILASG